MHLLGASDQRAARTGHAAMREHLLPVPEPRLRLQLGFGERDLEFGEQAERPLVVTDGLGVPPKVESDVSEGVQREGLASHAETLASLGTHRPKAPAQIFFNRGIIYG